jgi:acyl-CoA thioester hydrolase
MQQQKTAIMLPVCSNEKVPEAQHPFYHSIDIQTRFNDFDMLGHLNNAIYFQFLDLAKVSYFERALQHEIDMSGIGTVIVNININFFSPSYFREPLSVVTACTKISNRSFTLEQRVVNPDNGDVKCVATTIMATFDAKTAKSTEMSEEWVNALRKAESATI